MRGCLLVIVIKIVAIVIQILVQYHVTSVTHGAAKNENRHNFAEIKNVVRLRKSSFDEKIKQNLCKRNHFQNSFELFITRSLQYVCSVYNRRIKIPIQYSVTVYSSG